MQTYPQQQKNGQGKQQRQITYPHQKGRLSIRKAGRACGLQLLVRHYHWPGFCENIQDQV